MSSKRKNIYKKIFNKNISEKDNIDLRKPSDAETPEQEMKNNLDKNVPEGFKKKMDQLSKEELIADLFFTKYELVQAKRELELTTFELTELKKNQDNS